MDFLYVLLNPLVLVKVAGVIFVVVIAGLAITWWWSSARSIAMNPGEVHVVVGASALVTCLPLRKRARSTTYRFSPGNRNFNYIITGGVATVNPATSGSDVNGIGQCVVTGILAGQGGLKVSATSNQKNRTYGPNTIKVIVYPNAAAVPAGVFITPPPATTWAPVPSVELPEPH